MKKEKMEKIEINSCLLTLETYCKMASLMYDEKLRLQARIDETRAEIMAVKDSSMSEMRKEIKIGVLERWLKKYEDGENAVDAFNDFVKNSNTHMDAVEIVIKVKNKTVLSVYSKD